MSGKGPTVLVVDDEWKSELVRLRQAWAELRELKPEAPEIAWVGRDSPAAAIAFLEEQAGSGVSVILLDYHFANVQERRPHVEVLAWLNRHPEGPAVIVFTKEEDRLDLGSLRDDTQSLGLRALGPWQKSGFDRRSERELFAHNLLSKLRACTQSSARAADDLAVRAIPGPDELALDFRPRVPSITLGRDLPVPAELHDAAARLRGRLVGIAEVLLRLCRVDFDLCETWPSAPGRPVVEWKSYVEDAKTAFRILRALLESDRPGPNARARIPRASGGSTTFHPDIEGRRFWCNVTEAERIFRVAWKLCRDRVEDAERIIGLLDAAVELDPRHVNAWMLLAAARTRAKRDGSSTVVSAARRHESEGLRECDLTRIGEAGGASISDSRLEKLFLGGDGPEPIPGSPQGRRAISHRPRVRTTGYNETLGKDRAAGPEELSESRPDRAVTDLQELSERELQLRVFALQRRTGRDMDTLRREKGTQWILQQLLEAPEELPLSREKLLAEELDPEPVRRLLKDLAELALQAQRATTRKRR